MLKQKRLSSASLRVNFMGANYFFILTYLIFSIFLATIIFFLSYALILRMPDLEKLSSYECGFDPFESTHTNFEVRYFLVALLFILFDVEVSFLFPWSTLGAYLDVFSFVTGITYIFVLTLGFVYEWRKGALDFC